MPMSVTPPRLGNSEHPSEVGTVNESFSAGPGRALLCVAFVLVVGIVVVVDVVVVVSGAGHGSKRPKPNNPPQGAAVVVVVVVTSHTSLATSEQVWEPHENLHSNNDLPITFSQILCNLNSPQVTSQVWEQSWPLHWSTHAALGSVKRQQTALT